MKRFTLPQKLLAVFFIVLLILGQIPFSTLAAPEDAAEETSVEIQTEILSAAHVEGEATEIPAEELTEDKEAAKADEETQAAQDETAVIAPVEMGGQEEAPTEDAAEEASKEEDATAENKTEDTSVEETVDEETPVEETVTENADAQEEGLETAETPKETAPAEGGEESAEEIFVEETIGEEETLLDPALLAGPARAPAANSDPYFDIYWIDGTGGSSVHALSDADTNGHYRKISRTTYTDSPYRSNVITAQVEFSVGVTDTTNPLSPGSVQMILPRYLFDEWDWDDDGTSTKHAVDPAIGVGRKSNKTGKGFWYYYASKDPDTGAYVEDSAGTYIILENYETLIDVPLTFTCDIQYPYSPSSVDSTKQHVLQAEYHAYNQDGSEKTRTVVNNQLTAELVSKSTLQSVTKDIPKNTSNNMASYVYSEWNEDWGEFPSDILDENEDYVYVGWRITATVATPDLNQPFYLFISEEEPGVDGAAIKGGSGTANGHGEGKIVAISPWGSYSSFHTIDYYKTEMNYDETDTRYDMSDYNKANDSRMGDGSYPLNNVTGSSYTKGNAVGSYDSFGSPAPGGRDFTEGILVAYPKEYIDKMLGQDSNPTDYLTNQVTVTKVPYDKSQPTETKTAAVADRYEKVNFKYDGIVTGFRKMHTSDSVMNRGEDDKDTGNKGNTDKEKSTISGGAWSLKQDNDVQLFTYSFGTGYTPLQLGGLTLKNRPRPQYPYDEDNQPTFVYDDYSDFGQASYTVEIMDDMIILNDTLLGPGDYDIVNVSYTSSESNLDPDDDFKTISVPYEEKAKPDLYVRYENNGAWILYDTDAESYSTRFAPNDEGLYPIGVKYVFTSNAFRMAATGSMTVKLNHTENVKNALRGTGTDLDQVTNVASFIIKDEDGNFWNLYDENSIQQTGYMRQYVMEHDQKDGASNNIPQNMYYVHDRTYQYLSDLDSETTFTKSSTANNNPNAQMSDATYTLRTSQTLSFYTEDAAKLLETLDNLGVQYGQKEITFYDLLPEAAVLDISTLSARYNASDSSPSVAGVIDSYSTIDNFHDSGRTLLVVKVKFPEGQDSDWGKKWNSTTGILNLGTNVTLSFKCLYDWNDLAFYGKAFYNQAAAEVPGSGDGSNDDASSANGVYSELRPYMSNLHDADGGSSGGNDMYYDTAYHSFSIVTSSLTGYSKLVKAESESSYRANSAVQPGESYSYRLRYAAEANTEAKDIIMYDVLEYAFVDAGYMSADGHQEKYDLTGGRYWLGTFDHVNVSAAQKMGVDVKVYYSVVEDREDLQKGLNNRSSGYGNLSNTAIWKGPFTAAQVNGLSDAEKAKITAVAFDCSKKTDGSDFIMRYNTSGSEVLMLYIYMTGPDEEEIKTGRDGKGSYVDPEYVYAYNNSFLSTSSSPAGTSNWSQGNPRLSAGTTVRTSEPHPELYKAEEKENYAAADESTWAGAYSEADADEAKDHNSVSFEDKNEIIKYVVTTKVPILGTDSSGEDEKSTFTVYDTLVNELEFANVKKVRIEIGEKDGDNYFLYDPEADSPKGTYKIKRNTLGRAESGTFDSLEELPFGFTLTVNNDNSYGYGTNRISLMLSYNEKETTDDDGKVTPVFDRVNDFAGEKLSMSFYAKVRQGASLAAYADGKIPNTAHYTIPGHLGNDSNTVYLDVPVEEPKIPYKTQKLVDDDGNVVDEEAQVFYVINKEDGAYVDDVNGDHIKVLVSYDDAGNVVLKDKNGEDFTLAEGQDIRAEQDVNNMSQTIEYTVHGTIPESVSAYALSDTLVSALELDPESVTMRIFGNASVGNYKRTDYYYLATGDDAGTIVTEKPDWGTEGEDWWLRDTVYEKDYNDDGTLDAKTIAVDRSFDADELSRMSSGFGFEADNRSWRLEMNSMFINQYGDFYVGSSDGEEEYTDYDPETGEPVQAMRRTFVQGEYGAFTINMANDFGLAGLQVEVSFRAKIKEGADLTNYSTEDGIEIPNTAKYRFGNNAEEDTNTVYLEIPEVDKKVNGRTSVTLANQDEVFTYRIGAVIPSVNTESEEGEEPEVLEKALLTDTLEDVLEFANTSQVKFFIDGEEQATDNISFDGQTITVDLLQAAKNYPARYATVEFDAKIRKDVTFEQLEKYVNRTSEAEIPNQATLTVKLENSPETVRQSKPVTVTPPPIEKKVNDKEHEDLESATETFTYTIKTWMPETDKTDEKATSFKVLDTLEDVLTFATDSDVLVQVDGTVCTDCKVTKEGQQLTVSFEEEVIEQNPRKLVLVSFDAQVKEGSDLTPYLTDDVILIPNISSFVINNDPAVESNSVTVTPPEDEPEPGGGEKPDPKPDPEPEPEPEPDPEPPKEPKPGVPKKNPPRNPETKQVIPPRYVSASKTADVSDILLWFTLLCAGLLLLFNLVSRRGRDSL